MGWPRARIRLNPETGQPEYDDTPDEPDYAPMGNLVAPSRRESQAVSPVIPEPVDAPLPAAMLRRPPVSMDIGAPPNAGTLNPTLPEGVGAPSGPFAGGPTESGQRDPHPTLRPSLGIDVAPDVLAQSQQDGPMPLSPVMPGVTETEGGYARNRLDPYARAEQELGGEPKRGGWGMARDIAGGVLAGMLNRPVPESLDPQARHRAYEGAVDRRAAIYGQAQQHDEQEQDRARGIDADKIRQQVMLSQIEENKAQAEEAIARARHSGRDFVVHNGSIVYKDDPEHPVPVAGLKDPKPDPRDRIVNRQNADGSQSIFTMDESGALHPASYADGSTSPVVNAPKPTAPNVAMERKKHAIAYAKGDTGKATYTQAYNEAVTGEVGDILQDYGGDVDQAIAAIQAKRAGGKPGALAAGGQAGDLQATGGGPSGGNAEYLKSLDHQLQRLNRAKANAATKAAAATMKAGEDDYAGAQ